MRGLVQFIADLRNARARDLEEKRINKELANIRLVATVPLCFVQLVANQGISHVDKSSRVCSQGDISKTATELLTSSHRR